MNHVFPRVSWCFLLFVSSLFPWKIQVLRAQDLIITEFVAANNRGIQDEDGQFSDWIEIHNPEQQAVSLAGWYLSNNPGDLMQWGFPDMVIAGQGFIQVFASGKDRTDPEAPLHTNFKLNRDGEYLALIRPDGQSVVGEYAPTYPRQLSDVSYGTLMATETTVLIADDSLAQMFVPEDNQLGWEWTLPDFDDSLWIRVRMGLGYVRPSADNGPHPDRPLEDATRPGDLILPTSFNSPATDAVANVIDNNLQTRYRNFDSANAGFMIIPSAGDSAIVGLRLTSANDVPQRDPASFELWGSQDETSLELISTGSIPPFTERLQTQEIRFANTRVYRILRLIFPQVANPDTADSMQIAEVEFLRPGAVPVTELEDVTQPDDAIDPTSFNSPTNEEVDKAIDNDPRTKYLNFDKLDAGFTVTPAQGPSVVRGLRLTSANDAPERDPTSFRLLGSTNGRTFTEIASGPIPDFTGRFTPVDLAFENAQAYTHYQLLFPTVRNANSAVAVQIAEVEFLGQSGAPPVAFADLIRTNVEATLFDHQSSAYLRFPFEVHEGQSLDELALHVHYDDGFVAFLNGVEVASANAPENLGHNARATHDRARDLGVVAERFSLSEYAHLVLPGKNVLAIQALNDRVDSPDFLIQVRLENTQVRLGEAGYFELPTPGSINGPISLDLVADPVVDRQRGFYEAPFEVTITSSTHNAVIRYTTNGSVPSETSGDIYDSPILIDQTTVLRVAALRDQWRPSQVLTHTYLFLKDVVTQDRSAALDAGFPPTWNGQAADYGLDSRVVGARAQDNYGGKYAATLKDDLLSLPSMSIVMDTDDMFGSRGIYANPTARGDNWERATSLELIYPDERAGFQENAGIRIQGGAFRRFDLTLKKSFRLIFKEAYGATKLRYPLFGPEAAQAFDNFILRANSNDAWPYGGANAVYIRDTFAMESMRAMGQVASHTMFVHLYINGFYWGLYNPVERPDAAFSASYHGGDKDTWDAINQDSVPDGNRDAWNRLLALLNEDVTDNEVYQRIQGNDPDGTRNPAHEDLLDVENMIDYMILNFYVGNSDWPHRNHWEGRNRDNGDGFQFYPWDTETALSGLNTNRTGVNNAVAYPYGVLRANADFRTLFGDRVQQHFFHGGAFYVNPDRPTWDPDQPENNRPAARFAALADHVEPGITGESARWGDQKRNTPYTPDEHWRPRRDNRLTSYFPNRSEIVLDQFRAAGLYPRIDAPAFSQQGGRVDPGFLLFMNASEGSIFYSTDGSDPIVPVQINELSRNTLITGSTVKKVLVPSRANSGDELGSTWHTHDGINDSSWRSGTRGVGYDTGTGYNAYIGIDVRQGMQQINGSVFIRIPFVLTQDQLARLNFMTLKMRYDDGFVAYLNGVRIAAENAPGALQWSSFATGGHDDDAAVQFSDFDVSAFINRLQPGPNLLAIHGLNVSLGSSDFLIDTQLIAGERHVITEAPTALEYTTPLVLQDRTLIKARAFNGQEWSALNQALFSVRVPSLVITELHYHPGASTEAEQAAGFSNADDFEFIELFNAGPGTIDLNGMAFVDGIEFDFTDAAIHLLAPEQAVLVVKNQEAFSLRYGSDLPIAGEYSGRLSNSGERIEFRDATGETILAFTYGTQDPWPESPDGDGPSLELIDLNQDPNSPDNWRASNHEDGSPGN